MSEPRMLSESAFVNFAKAGLYLDLEVNPADGAIKQVGATLGEWGRRGSGLSMPSSWREIEARAEHASYIAGHNLLEHDLAILARVHPGSSLLRLPIIDTLVLSTLAFPKRPFHALTKSYKRSDAERNNPLLDAEQSRELLADCLNRLQEEQPSRIKVYAALLGGMSDQGDSSIESMETSANLMRLGWAMIFERLGIGRPSPVETKSAWEEVTGGVACRSRANKIFEEALVRPEVSATSTAMAIAWMSEENATFPPWALHNFRDTVKHLRVMRSEGCGEPECEYCTRSCSPEGRLKEFFQYPEFRPTPEVNGRPGVSLQREIVRLGMADEPLLGILPTGGGKSLCFQIPALHRHRTRGSLTVVISPLQSLMKDQVENLRQRFGIRSAGAIYGGLSGPERQLLFNEVADGTIGILYLSPEQLRNANIKKLLTLRDIGAWVFDEAHCVAKWGHDFRPDYRYVARAILEISRTQSVVTPPIQAYTATAKSDVRSEIIEHFENEIGRPLTVLDGGAERENLFYRVETMPSARKEERIAELLREKFEGGAPGAAVIFCASRKDTEKLAALLSGKGISCGFFHAGIENREEKEAIQDKFMSGEFRVMAATNAFGMGVDKADIRLVIHHRMPGSLENYLQEAGRAGRDGQPAEAVLLHDPESDADWQLDMLDMSKLLKPEIEKILKIIRNRARKSGRAGTTVLSATEIMDAIRPVGACAEQDRDETFIKASIAHLERCELLIRDDNVNRVFQVRPLCRNTTEAAAIIDRLALSDSDKALWRAIMKVVFSPDVATPAVFLDTLCGLEDMRPHYERAKVARRGREPNEHKVVIELLTAMCGKRIGLLERDISFSAVIRTANAHNPLFDWGKLTKLETSLLSLLSESHPDLQEEPLKMDYAALAASLTEDKSKPVSPEKIRRIVERWPYDLQRLKSLPNGLVIRSHGPSGSFLPGKNMTWSVLRETISIRQQAGSLIAGNLLEKARRLPAAPTSEGEDASQRNPLLEFRDTDLADVLEDDLTFRTAGLDRNRTLQLVLHTLVALDKTSCLQLVQGKSIITSAMTLRIPEGRQRAYTSGDHAPLDAHHKERVFQVHVMSAYAQRFAVAAKEAYELLIQYFVLTKAAFISRYFSDDPKQVDLACTLESFFKITRRLSPVQSSIVCDTSESNLMILAGPGSGKTRVIVHRVAFLIKVLREKPDRIAILCFNRNAAMELRRRLHDLAGSLSARVIIGTYHSLALRLTGRRLDSEDTQDEKVFDKILAEATALLEGAVTPDGEDEAEFLMRLQGGFSHIFVDEYQDINDSAYKFVAALAGKGRSTGESRPRLTAVGDDDQSIYGFQKADVGFIRRFTDDYQAKSRDLVENFRSTAAIIDASNRMIAPAADRMKSAPIEINSARANNPPGGNFGAMDSIARGRVQVLVADGQSEYLQARLVIAELRRLRKLDPEAKRSDFAVISPRHDSLMPVRHMAELAKIPLVYRSGKAPYDLRAERVCAAFRRRLSAELSGTIDLRTEIERLAESSTEAEASLALLLQELSCKIETDSDDAKSPLLVPASVVFRHIDEGLRDLKSGLRQGDGVLLSTAHSAKGLEFDHVLILDHPHWSEVKNEETRRLFYVAMTRARKTLTVVTSSTRCSKLVTELSSLPGIIQNRLSVEDADPSPKLRYLTLSLDCFVISYAGWHAENSSIHQALSKLSSGDIVVAERSQDRKIHLLAKGVRIARLSSKGEQAIGHLVDAGAVHLIKILALVERTAEITGDFANQPKIQAPRWEIPIVEVSHVV